MFYPLSPYTNVFGTDESIFERLLQDEKEYIKYPYSMSRGIFLWAYLFCYVIIFFEEGLLDNICFMRPRNPEHFLHRQDPSLHKEPIVEHLQWQREERKEEKEEQPRKKIEDWLQM